MMDYGTALEAYWYADRFAYYNQTIQKNHLQGKEQVHGGYALLDRRFAYHDWSVWNHDGDNPTDDPILTGDFEQISGNGLKVVNNDADTWIGEGSSNIGTPNTRCFLHTPIPAAKALSALQVSSTLKLNTNLQI